MVEIWPMVAPISLIAATNSCVASCMPAMWLEMSSVAFAVWLASDFTSDGDHGKAAAGVARARRLDRGVEREQIGLLGDRSDQLDHVADLCAARDNLPMRASVCLRLLHGGFRNAVGFAHLLADLVDRGRQFFGRRRHRLDVGGGDLGGAGDLARQPLRGFRRARQRARRLLQLLGRRRDVGDDRADRGLEIVGKANQLGAARGARGLVLRVLRSGVALGLGDRLQLELLDRARHLAELVLAPEAGQHDVEIAVRELAHGAAHRNHRRGDAAAEQQRQHRAEQGAADREHHDQALGLADRRVRFAVRSRCCSATRSAFIALAPWHDRAGRSAHLRHEIVDRLGVLDQFGQRLAIVGELALASFRPPTILSSVALIACSEFSTNFSRASALFATVWSAIDDKGVGERDGGLQLRMVCLAPNSTA